VIALATGTSGVLAQSARGDDASHHEYSVLYGGNFSPSDAHRFAFRLHYFGGTGIWTGKTQTSYDAPQDDVAHWDVTNGYSGVDRWPGANRRDLMYLSTHGWPGQLRFYSPRWVGSTRDNSDWRRRLDQNGHNDNIGPRDNDLCGSNTFGWERNLWEIGATYPGWSVTRTNSRWNDDIEWVFLAACNQLSAGGNSPGSRALYARTLLGDPRRAHSIMGYQATAPGDATDVGIVDSFFDQVALGNSIRYSWLQANSYFSGSAKNAAVLLHERHTYEGLPPVRARQADSPTGEIVDMRFWYLNLLGNHIGGPHLGSNESLWSRGVAALREAFAIPKAMANSETRLIQGRNTTFRVGTEFPKAPNGVSPLVLKSDRPEPEEVARRTLGGGRAVAGALGQTKGSRLFERDGKRLMVFEGDGFLLDNGEEYGNAVVDFTVHEAVEAAKRYIGDHGGLPADAVLNGVTGVAAASVDPLTGKLTDEKTHAYIVEYGHEHAGIPIAGTEGDSIRIVLAAGKRVCEMRTTWREVSHSGRPVQLIDAEAAFEAVAREGERVTGLPPVVEVQRARLVYYANKSSSRQSVMWPAWEFTLVEEGAESGAMPAVVYVDAQSGRVVTD